MSGENSQQASLVPRAIQPGMESKYVLRGDQITVGRHPSNDIVLALDSISRFHSRIDRRGNFYILQDLNSSNGSHLNGERVTQATINHGDLVAFGDVEFQFENEDGPRIESDAPPSSFVGKSIIDFTDEQPDGVGSSKSFVKAEDFQGAKAKSSLSSSVVDKKADRGTLLKLNARLGALYKLSELFRDATSFQREEAILQRILEIVFSAVGADRGVILTKFNRDAENLDVAAVKYRDEPIVAQKVQVSRTILKEVVANRVAILSKDTTLDERYATTESILVNQIRSTIAAPMSIGDELIGVIHLDSSTKGKTFEQDDLEFVMIVATETGVSLHNMRMQKEATHRERLAAVGETVAGISHNVKNILLLSQGGAELLTRAIERRDVDGTREAWQVVSRGIDKIGKLVRDMLEFSSHKKAELTDVDVNEMICGTAEEIEGQLIAKGVTLELDLDESITPQPLDELGLQRTVMNLIVNAMEAIAHQQGQISVTTKARHDTKRMVIRVRDNGAGISTDKMEKVFFPFYTTKGSSGTGLGLPMCKKVVEDMQGTITCESEENVGTVFQIELPLAAKA
ncbi:FHA domain-containing protein [Candidatus Sumerlaeota bacterium]|nr:FHA domain-containing protein [Candidatus Sumerlaeota bacterium]